MMEAPEPVYAEAPAPVMAPPIADRSVPTVERCRRRTDRRASACANAGRRSCTGARAGPAEADGRRERLARDASGDPAGRAGPSRSARPVARAAAGESRSPNLFQRITGAFAAPKTAPAPMAAPVDPSSRPRAVRAGKRRAGGAQAGCRSRSRQPSMNLDVTERAKPARDDDDLQIPAFLRRQAN